MELRMKYKGYEVFKEGIWWMAWLNAGGGWKVGCMKSLTQKGIIKKIDKHRKPVQLF